MPHSSSFGQVRAYSSDRKHDTGSEFGFQSLGSLFPTPPSPGRYSRPKERRAEEAASKESEERAPTSEVQKDSTLEKPYSRSASPPGPIESTSNEKNAAKIKASVEANEDKSREFTIRRVDQGVSIPAGRTRERISTRRLQAPAKLRATRPTSDKSKVPNPFAAKPKQNNAPAEAGTEDRANAKAWGLSQEDQDTVDSLFDPKIPLVAKDASNSQAVAKTAENAPTATNGPRLTHVKPSGEAHMVDVGDKASTKRVAIAVAHIGLTKAVYDQIVENGNKKGDVLGIARIAGIMAAKRTSDIIPLCHPLAISKAEVDVYLVPWCKPSKESNHFWMRTRDAGSLVAIQARVECVGPTGVEMEALMAVQGAALTIVDMCKAVEKRLTIHGAKVVYKAGGRSGVHVDPKWKQHVGDGNFETNGELKDGVNTLLTI